MMTLAQRRSAAARKGARTRKLMKDRRLQGVCAIVSEHSGVPAAELERKWQEQLNRELTGDGGAAVPDERQVATAAPPTARGTR